MTSGGAGEGSPIRPGTLVMGILNVTPDSFSDGGRWASPEAALAHGLRLREQGADIIDVGGESARPGACRIGADEELSRVMPVVEGLARLDDPPRLSIDTRRAVVAEAAVAAGADLVNDVSGGLDDPVMLPLVARLGVDYVCQRWRAVPGDVPRLGPGGTGPVPPGTAFPAQALPAARWSLVAGLAAELVERRDACLAGGLAPAAIVLDPGLGFATSAQLDWAVLRHLDAFTALGHRLAVGASRKRFLAPAGGWTAPTEPDAATATVTAWCALHDVWAVRVHDVAGTRAALRVADHLYDLDDAG